MVQDRADLAYRVVRRQGKLVTDANSALDDFAVDDDTAVHLLIQNGNSKRTSCISDFDWHIIHNFHETRALIPRATLFHAIPVDKVRAGES